jgi:hypothetical protein
MHIELFLKVIIIIIILLPDEHKEGRAGFCDLLGSKFKISFLCSYRKEQIL